MRASNQAAAFSLTFAAYATFHAARKPPSIAKSVLSSSWPPFDSPRGPHRLGELDVAFLSSYAASMYVAGHFADRADLRRLLTASMLATGLATILFGLGFFLRVHSLSFFLAAQFVGGVVQSAGWPCVVAVIGNWFGKSRRGLIMGVWNSHTSFGNILGSVVASSALEFGWGWAFILPGVLIAAVGVVVFAFLVPHPSKAGFQLPEEAEDEDKGEIEINGGGGPVEVNVEEVELLESNVKVNMEAVPAIRFMEAWKLPGVAPFALCLFFSKLVAYTFLYWLPFYIRNTAVAGEQISHKTAGILSTVFDVGGVFGGISAGFISDSIGARAVTSILFLFLSIPALILYRSLGSISLYWNISLLLISGYFVNGPYALITTAVAADLGTQDAIKGNSRALATVTAIIDGTGSVGAALGPLLTGYISTRGWSSVFFMLILSISLAIMCLIHLAKAEVISNVNKR